MKRVLPVPREKRAKRGDDESASPIKIELFGPWGSGKTFAIVGLLEYGLKVLVVTTDIGGSGLNSVKLHLRRNDKTELLKNLMEIVLVGDEELQAFLSHPTTFFPDLYTFDPDVLFWDGFGAWQQVDLSERIGEMPVERKGQGNELPAAVDAGLMFETPQWGMLRNATTRAVHKFCSLNNLETGKVWHKVVTVQEGYKSKQQGQGGFQETKMPLVQGAGGILMGGAFDLIIRSKKETIEEKGKIIDKFKYEIRGENLMSKVRGFVLPAEMEADMFKLWSTITEQAGINKKEN